MLPSQLPIDLNALTEANRPIRLRLSNERGVVDDLLLVKQVSGVETICGGIEYVLLCVSSQAGMELKQFVANPAELQFVTSAGRLLSVCGIVGAIAEGQSDGGLATYQLIVRDALSLLEQTCNTRVFRQASEVDITNIILREWRASNPVAARAFDVDLRHLKSYPSREFTMQYNESNAAFLRRLWKRRGIAWYIHSAAPTERGSNDSAVHTLVLFDDPASLKENAAGPARYHRDDSTEKRDGITSWHAVRTLTAGQVTRRSWDYAQAWSMASENIGSNDQGPLGNRFAASLDDYLVDVPHAGDDSADYRQLGILRMQRKEYESKFFRGESGDRDMSVGRWRRMDGHPEIDVHPPEEREFVITELRIEAENNLPKTLNERVCRLFALNHWSGAADGLEQANAERGMRYSNRFTCVRRGIPIVPAYDPRSDLPRTDAQTVTVVGPVDEEIHCDQFGRIKVRFPACRTQDHQHAQGAGASDSERDSAWLRLASGWAGERYGAVSLPRVGDEVVVVFLGGDPDKPLIIGRVHGGKTPPPSFSHTSRLPGDKHLSGIVSKEGKARRYNQLRLDDTPGQISAQLESEHGHSQLNLGYLTEPRCDGRADARGEGAELRSDGAVAIRGARGVLISADASLRAAGRQLERDGLAGLAEALVGIQKQLAELAETHQAGPADGAPLAQVSSHVTQWENGSNTVAGPAPDGGAPIVGLQGPAGVLVGSGASVSIGAQTHVDLVSVGNTQVSAGRKLMLHAMQSLSLFAHTLGAKLIAASGKVEIQAHADNVEITSAKRIVLVASEEVVIEAPKVTVVTKGAQARFGGGDIRHECSGMFEVKSATTAFNGPGDGQPAAPRMPDSTAAHDQRVRIVDLSTGEPMPDQRYRATMEDGQVVEGRTDAQGMTQKLTSSIPFAHFSIEALDD
ncbi:type VI secretion system tip protein VgrG [Massilia atriviolacea]|uniref:Type VI secretion system tip protein VgrG n=1 Tax=Massilia atriviolacea TaxID=2495579 RepID=A0A430HH96_9BURK|nr:type VI secretion system Vgr family protein [Massilia atriviolacea]RSZ56872.1 type VI secretion system tip protein VgrG [Massilia atriviolacea]